MICTKVSACCLLAVVFGILFESSHAGTTVCNCLDEVGGCPAGQKQSGNCSFGGKKYPRCCLTSGPDDGCNCKATCKANEYQKDSCVSGHLCCPRRPNSQWYNPDTVQQ